MKHMMGEREMKSMMKGMGKMPKDMGTKMPSGGKKKRKKKGY